MQEHRIYIPGTVLSLFGFLLSAGVVGGLEHNTMSFERGIFYGILGTVMMGIGVILLSCANASQKEDNEGNADE